MCFEIQAHRGARSFFPENTIQAFCKAADLGVRVVELDLVDGGNAILQAPHHERQSGRDNGDARRLEQGVEREHSATPGHVARRRRVLRLHQAPPDDADGQDAAPGDDHEAAVEAEQRCVGRLRGDGLSGLGEEQE